MKASILVICLLVFPAFATAEGTDVQSVVSTLPLDDIQRAFDGAAAAAEGVGPLLERALSGESLLDLEAAWQDILLLLREALLERRALLLRLFGPVLLCAVLRRFQTAWGSGRASAVAQWVLFLYAAQEAARQCAQVCQQTMQAVSGAADGMRTLFPPVLTLLTAVGGSSSAAVVRPLVTLAVSAVVFVCEKVCMPLAAAYLALTVLDGMTDALSLSRAAKLCRAVSNTALGVALTVFTGVMAVRGFTAAVRDGASLRAAKFAVDSFVPEVGGMLSDTAETVAASSLLVKNALGVTGMTLICSWLAAPLVRIVLTGVVFRIAGALAEPLDDGRMTQCLDGACGAMGMLSGCLLCAGTMFLVLLAQAVAAGNIVAMMA